MTETGHGFIKSPKELYTNPEFENLSSDAKTLFSMILDRTEISYLNRERFTDENGEVFIYFTVEQICSKLGCGHNKAVRLLTELERNGMIIKARKGCGKPTRIIVSPAYRRFLEKEYYSSRNGNINIPEKGKSVFPKEERINTYNNNNNMNNTYSSSSYEETVREIEMQIESECINGDKDIVREIIMIMADTLTFPQSSIRIGGIEYPKETVVDRYRLLRAEHIENIVYDINHIGRKILNMKNFMMAMLFNAPLTYASSSAAEFSYGQSQKAV